VLPIWIAHPSGEPAVQVPVLVDTGSDGTILTAQTARALGLPAADSVRVIGIGGDEHEATMYVAQVDTGAGRRNVKVAAIGERAIVGRDLLNQMVIRLVGPRAVLEVED
jgi:predicted aspartyl protease